MVQPSGKWGISKEKTADRFGGSRVGQMTYGHDNVTLKRKGWSQEGMEEEGKPNQAARSREAHFKKLGPPAKRTGKKSETNLAEEIRSPSIVPRPRLKDKKIEAKAGIRRRANKTISKYRGGEIKKEEQKSSRGYQR